jgi:hypothetical protein
MARNLYDDDETPDYDDFLIGDTPPDNSPEVNAWLSEELEATDELGITTHAGATYLVPGYLNGGYDNRESMRLCEIGEIVWYQAEEHKVVETYPDYCGGHSYGLVSLVTGIHTVANINLQGWGAKTREEWSWVWDEINYEQLYPKPRDCPDVSLRSFLRDTSFRIKEAVKLIMEQLSI